MASDVSYPHLDKLPGEPARLRRFPRVTVAQIALDHLAHGWSANEIQKQHPHLTLSEVHASLAYYFDHAEEIDREIQSELEELSQDQEPPERSPLVKRLKAKGLI